MNYLNIINEAFPIRRSAGQKAQFREFVEAECRKLDHPVRTEVLQGKQANVVIGNIEQAQVVFTAHYDTPAVSLLPNLMAPRSHFLLYLYQFGYPTTLALFSLLTAYVLMVAFKLEFPIFLITYLVLYFAIFYLCTRAFPNKHNKNDNTSGVAVILSLLSRMEGGKVACILFDNEEKGLQGSKAYAKVHKAEMESKLVINLDCVGVGQHILVIAKDKAAQTARYRLLQETLTDDGPFQVVYFPAKGSNANSDHKSFPCSIGILACRKGRHIGYYATAIHTPRDTVANTENIDFISEKIVEFLKKQEETP